MDGAKWQMKCNFESSKSFPGLSSIPIATAKEMAMYNNKLAHETELRSVILFLGVALQMSPTRMIY